MRAEFFIRPINTSVARQLLSLSYPARRGFRNHPSGALDGDGREGDSRQE
jgi:hypothetical protein